MADIERITITLPSDMAVIVKRAVEDGDYASRSEVVRAALLAVPHEIRIKIRNLFDRRNRNTISHPSSDYKIAWEVTKSEYMEYREVVGKCLKLIIRTS
jgi:Arc/MetJ-type ribon-helix-helix transcriptional regulator